jgi:hypothetical protein
MKKGAIIAVDFDGTIVEHAFPSIGPEVPGAISCLRRLIDAGHHLILYTMRSSSQEYGDTLASAVAWCRERKIEFWAVNENLSQCNWSTSPKVYAQIYIDDSAIGCPLLESAGLGRRPYADWDKIEGILVEKGYL